uniref:Uncharacterized protein n=1 Tax=Rhizophora mucronata TaxID=61149 RepID=A0A2P2Q457_RHIMU
MFTCFIARILGNIKIKVKKKVFEYVRYMYLLHVSY